MCGMDQDVLSSRCAICLEGAWPPVTLETTRKGASSSKSIRKISGKVLIRFSLGHVTVSELITVIKDGIGGEGLRLGQKHGDRTILTWEGGERPKRQGGSQRHQLVPLPAIGLTPLHPVSILNDLQLLCGWNKDRSSITYSNCDNANA